MHLLIERIEDFSSNLRLDLLQDPLIFERDLQRRLEVFERRHVPTSASGLMSAKTSEQGKRLLILPTVQPPVESRNLLVRQANVLLSCNRYFEQVPFGMGAGSGL